MRISKLIFTLGILIISSFTLDAQSANLSRDLIHITANESKGVDEVLRFYGGQCRYSVGTSLAQGRYFELEMSKSILIQKFASVIKLPSSNIAYLFYKNLGEESAKYDEIRAVIILDDGSKQVFAFPRSLLQIVVDKMPLVFRFTRDLKEQKYGDLLQILPDGDTITVNKKMEWVENIKKIESGFDPIKEFRPYGFRMFKTANGTEILRISGSILREGRGSQLGIRVLAHDSSNKILSFEYEF